MSGKNLPERVLKTIRKKGIKPRPRWEFLLKDYSIWFAGVLALVVGSLAFSVIVYMFKNNDWDIYKYLNNSLLSFVFGSLPYFWLVLLVIFILTAHYNFKHTKRGYKYQLHLMIIGNVLASIFLGIFLYNIGIGQTINGLLSERVPFYNKFINRRMMKWAEIDKGFMAGLITEVIDSEHFKIKDFRGGDWNIDGAEALMTKDLEIGVDDIVRIVGEKVDESTFKAKIIAPGRPPARHPMMKNGPFPDPKFLPERNFLDWRIKR